MNLTRLAELGRLQPHETTPEEMAKLRALVERRLSDAQMTTDSADWRFMAAYNAARTLAKMVLAVAGWRVTGYGQHFTTFHAVPSLMGERFSDLSGYFDDCREKRNVAEYDEADTIMPSEAEELIGMVIRFRPQVESWIADTCPDLALPPAP